MIRRVLPFVPAMLAGTLLLPAAMSAEVLSLSVSGDRQTYSVAASFMVDRCETVVRDVFTDFSQLSRLNPAISDSTLLHRGTDHAVVRTGLRECALFFCRQMVLVERVEYVPGGALHSRVLPGTGDFSAGWARWEFRALGRQTRVTYTGEIHLAEPVPPLLGAPFIRARLERNLRETVSNAEQLAMIRDETVPGRTGWQTCTATRSSLMTDES